MYFFNWTDRDKKCLCGILCILLQAIALGVVGMLVLLYKSNDAPKNATKEDTAGPSSDCVADIAPDSGTSGISSSSGTGGINMPTQVWSKGASLRNVAKEGFAEPPNWCDYKTMELDYGRAPKKVGTTKGWYFKEEENFEKADSAISPWHDIPYLLYKMIPLMQFLPRFSNSEYCMLYQELHKNIMRYPSIHRWKALDANTKKIPDDKKCEPAYNFLVETPRFRTTGKKEVNTREERNPLVPDLEVNEDGKMVENKFPMLWNYGLIFFRIISQMELMRPGILMVYDASNEPEFLKRY